MTKMQRALTVFCTLILLTGCSTMTVSPEAQQQNLPASAAQHLNDLLNTAQDGQPQVWHSEDGDTQYQLTTRGTRINAAGLPCRDYSLLINRKYHRAQTTSGTICRDNGKWQISP